MSSKPELERKYQNHQYHLDNYFSNKYGEGYYHHQDYQKYSDLASHISNIETENFNIVVDYFSIPSSINWTDYFNLFFEFYSPNDSLINFYRFCIDEIDKLRAIFDEAAILDAINNNYIVGEYSKDIDSRVMIEVINKLNIKTYHQSFENNTINKLKLIELKVLILERIIEIKDSQSKKLITLKDSRKLEVFIGLKQKFDKNDYDDLEKALEGHLLPEPIHFKSRQTYLIEFFRRLEYNYVIEVDRPKLIKWLCENFTYTNTKKNLVKFKRDTVIAYLNETKKSKQPCKIKKEKRILSTIFPYQSKQEIMLNKENNI